MEVVTLPLTVAAVEPASSCKLKVNIAVSFFVP